MAKTQAAAMTSEVKAILAVAAAATAWVKGAPQ
jgi:hypothetical protein